MYTVSFFKNPSWKLFLFFVAFFYLLAIFYHLLQRRPGVFEEGMTTAPKVATPTKKDPKAAQTGGASPQSSHCKDAKYTDDKNMPLKEYTVKSCFNSAYDGAEVSAETLEKRIQEGYRFLDLNVFSASGGNLFVGFSRDNAPVLTSVKLTFATAIETIKKSAFADTKSSSSSASAPLKEYVNNPIFVHLRVYRPPESTEDIVAKIADWLKKPDQMYLRDSKGAPVEVNACTPLSKLQRKMIFSIDIENLRQIYAPTNNPSVEYIPEATQKAMRTFVNLVSGGYTMLSFYRYNDYSLRNRTKKLLIPEKGNTKKTNTEFLAIVFPHPTDDHSTNPDAASFLLNNSLQFVPMRAYIQDDNLAKYNKMFRDLNKSVVPLSYAYSNLTE